MSCVKPIYRFTHNIVLFCISTRLTAAKKSNRWNYYADTLGLSSLKCLEITRTGIHCHLMELASHYTTGDDQLTPLTILLTIRHKAIVLACILPQSHIHIYNTLWITFFLLTHACHYWIVVASYKNQQWTRNIILTFQKVKNYILDILNRNEYSYF